MTKAKLKTYRVHFGVQGNSFRDVQAFDELDAEDQVIGDHIDIDDCERADLSNISVDYVEEIKTRPKKKAKSK